MVYWRWVNFISHLAIARRSTLSYFNWHSFWFAMFETRNTSFGPIWQGGCLRRQNRLFPYEYSLAPIRVSSQP